MGACVVGHSDTLALGMVLAVAARCEGQPHTAKSVGFGDAWDSEEHDSRKSAFPCP